MTHYGSLSLLCDIVHDERVLRRLPAVVAIDREAKNRFRRIRRRGSVTVRGEESRLAAECHLIIPGNGHTILRCI